MALNLINKYNFILNNLEKYYTLDNSSFKNLENFIVDLLISLELTDYICDIEYIDEKLDFVGNYNNLSKKLYFNDYYNKIGCQNYHNPNIYHFLAIIHEIIHVQQEKNLNNQIYTENIKNKILLQSLKENLEINNGIYPLHEYQAYVESYYILFLFKSKILKIKLRENKIRLFLINSIINNYYTNELSFSSPLIISNKKHNIVYNESIIEESNIDSIEKILFGDIINYNDFQLELKNLNTMGGKYESSIK